MATVKAFGGIMLFTPVSLYLLSISAASFIYIALADLVAGRRATGGLRSLLYELPLIGLEWAP